MSPPVSLKTTARIAEESKTARLFKRLLHLAASLFAALGDKLVRSQSSRRGEFLELLLDSANSGKVRLDAEHSVLEGHDDDISGPQSHGFSDIRGNDDATIVIHSRRDTLLLCVIFCGNSKS